MAYYAGADDSQMSTMYWLGPAILISTLLTPPKMGLKNMLFFSLLISLLVLILGLVGFVVLPKWIFGFAFLRERFIFWCLHFSAIFTVTFIILLWNRRR
jgi:hypothetical protein